MEHAQVLLEAMNVFNVLPPSTRMWTVLRRSQCVRRALLGSIRLLDHRPAPNVPKGTTQPVPSLHALHVVRYVMIVMSW